MSGVALSLSVLAAEFLALDDEMVELVLLVVGAADLESPVEDCLSDR